jgi:hypothetical protein
LFVPSRSIKSAYVDLDRVLCRGNEARMEGGAIRVEVCTALRDCNSNEVQ